MVAIEMASAIQYDGMFFFNRCKKTTFGMHMKFTWTERNILNELDIEHIYLQAIFVG